MTSKKKVYSFDVFDTCIVRSCGTYDNFLEILSFKVFRANVSDAIRHKFIYARRLSESELLEKKRCNIFDIYQNLKFEHPLLFNHEELPKIEIKLENDVDLPVYNIKEKITRLRNEGHKILFISDMYLGEAILRPILSRLGLLETSDKVYVSCDVGCAKHNKSLYEYIKSVEHIKYKDWVHTGDNIVSDYTIPKSFGIKSILVHSDYSRYQKKWIANNNNSVITSYPYISILANLSKNILESEKSDSRKKFIIDIIAPLYCSFLFQVFSNAQNNGIKKMFFLARDTYQLYKVATIINTQYPDIEIKYLPISRNPLYHGDQKILLDYLVQEGLAEKETKCAIIDTSSSGQTITIINKLLDENNYNKINVSNLLLHINPQQFASISDGDYFAYISQSWEKNDYIECVLIESIFSTNNEKRVSNLIRSGEQILAEYDINPQNSDVIQENAQELQLMQSELLKNYTNHFIICRLYNYSSSILYDIALPTLFSFLQKPFKDYSYFLKDCKVKDNDITIPFVAEQNVLHFIRHRGNDTFWKRATVFLNLPNVLLPFYIKRKSLDKQ